MRRLEEEWTEVYGKFRTMQLRVAKTAQRLEENSSHEEATRGREGRSANTSAFDSLSPSTCNPKCDLGTTRAGAEWR